MKTLIHNDWQEILEPEFQKQYYLELHNFLKKNMQVKIFIQICFRFFKLLNGLHFQKSRSVY